MAVIVHTESFKGLIPAATALCISLRMECRLFRDVVDGGVLLLG